jgi:hypothetical protein
MESIATTMLGTFFWSCGKGGKGGSSFGIGVGIEKDSERTNKVQNCRRLDLSGQWERVILSRALAGQGSRELFGDHQQHFHVEFIAITASVKYI